MQFSFQVSDKFVRNHFAATGEVISKIVTVTIEPDALMELPETLRATLFDYTQQRGDDAHLDIRHAHILPSADSLMIRNNGIGVSYGFFYADTTDGAEALDQLAREVHAARVKINHRVQLWMRNGDLEHLYKVSDSFAEQREALRDFALANVDRVIQATEAYADSLDLDTVSIKDVPRIDLARDIDFSITKELSARYAAIKEAILARDAKRVADVWAFFKEWGENAGSKLLQGRIDFQFNWKQLCLTEFIKFHVGDAAKPSAHNDDTDFAAVVADNSRELGDPTETQINLYNLGLLRAKAIMDNVLGKFMDDVEIDVSLWRFDGHEDYDVFDYADVTLRFDHQSVTVAYLV